jgi:NAD(P)-dependent dehydrogenase (short-subunit alcohol dehydrogenase family)
MGMPSLFLFLVINVLIIRDSKHVLTATGYALHGAYVASKHGVIGLTRTAAKENGARNIRVNAVAPGAIKTPMLDEGDVIADIKEHN